MAINKSIAPNQANTEIKDLDTLFKMMEHQIRQFQGQTLKEAFQQAQARSHQADQLYQTVANFLPLTEMTQFKYFMNLLWADDLEECLDEEHLITIADFQARYPRVVNYVKNGIFAERLNKMFYEQMGTSDYEETSELFKVLQDIEMYY